MYTVAVPGPKWKCVIRLRCDRQFLFEITNLFVRTHLLLSGGCGAWRRFVCCICLLPVAIATLPAQPIKVLNARRLPADNIPATRIPLGISDDYKPWITKLKNGELLIVAFYSREVSAEQGVQGKSRSERAVFWWSKDGGKTWSEREERPDIKGREFSLNVLSDGTILMPCHFLKQDLANKAGHTYSKVFRSADHGRSWKETRIGPQGFPPQAGTATDWSAGEVPDPRNPGQTMAMFGVSMQHGGELAPEHVYLWRSRDRGRTWDKSLHPDTAGWSDVDGFFSQSTTYGAASGKLFHVVRVDRTGPHWAAARGGDDQAGSRRPGRPHDALGVA